MRTIKKALFNNIHCWLLTKNTSSPYDNVNEIITRLSFYDRPALTFP